MQLITLVKVFHRGGVIYNSMFLYVKSSDNLAFVLPLVTSCANTRSQPWC